MKVAVVVPVHNDRENLQPCLTALAASTYGHFDVLVVDDGSTEPIGPLVERFGYRHIRIDGPSGPARARNCGVQAIDGDLLVFVDADVCVYPDTIERFVGVFTKEADLSAAIGAYDDAPGDPGFVSQYRNLLHHFTHWQSAGEVTTFWSGCGAMRRDVFLKHGGFDERRYRRPAGEDIELGTWVAAEGGRILLDPSIQCKHLKGWSLGTVLRTDIWQRGVPWVELMLRSGQRARKLNVTWAQQLSVTLVFGALVLAVVSLWWTWALLGVASAMAVLTIVNVKLYRFFASRRGVWFAARSLPLHWLYFWCCGFSVIAGCWRFYVLGRRD